MARLIDADAVLDRYYAEHEQQDICDGAEDRDWLMKCLAEAPTLAQPNEPLTLEELREMSGQPFWDDAGSGWWIVAHVDGSKIYTEEGAILDFYEDGEGDSYFRRPPEGEEET